MEIEILSLFPDEFFQVPLRASLPGRALARGIFSVRCTDIRSFSEGAYSRVDDHPYGGGPGMVLMPGPVSRAIASVRKENSRIVYLSPQGSPLTPQIAARLATESHLILLCGHYEGIDQRVLDLYVDEEVSIGDYVLTSGGLPALVVIDALVRYLPGVLGNEATTETESFQEGCGLEGPQYTRPREFEGLSVPEVLLQGDHAKIAKWRQERSREKTERVRPELAAQLPLGEER